MENKLVTVPLSNGNSAQLELRLTNGCRRRAQLARDQSQGWDVSREFAQFNVMLCELIKEWTLPFPLPSADPSSLDELDVEDANSLYEALRPLLPKLYPNFSPKEPAGPTTPSSD